MGLIDDLIQFILHIDVVIQVWIAAFGPWTYVILFSVVFIETGIVIFPFFPGDSLIFAAGLFSNEGALDFWVLLVLFIAAAIIGDTVNYWIGNILGPRVFTEKSRLFKQKYVLEAQAFYERHGNATIFLGRFIPVIRTFVPFVAGIGKMKYRHFLMYNVLGGIVWVCLFLISGYFFGSIPWVKDNLSLIVIAIIVVSFIPVFYKGIKGLFKRNKSKSEGQTQIVQEETTVQASPAGQHDEES
jgi:membrane-associated protein